MLIKCPECELQASDKAVACPHCGYPFLPNIAARKTRKSNKRKRLPNGFGQISEIKGRALRNPFRAMITVGKTETGKPICELLKPRAFFASYNDAYTALVEHNKNPYEVEKTTTISELYDRWLPEYMKKTDSMSTIRSIKAAWAYCYPIYDMQVADIRIRHIRVCMEESKVIIRGKEHRPSAQIKMRIKSLISFMLDYAVEYEIVSENCARNFKISSDVSKKKNKVEKSHISFTDEEMDLLWGMVDTVPYVDIVLIQCYSGWRPQELGLIELSNVDIVDWIFSGGIKTDAGYDRVVPIHSKIRGLVEKRYNEAVSLGSKYVFNCADCIKKNDFRLTYDRYKTRYAKAIKDSGVDKDHRPHDPRKRFVTSAKKYKVDEYAIKYMVGHAINDITEKVYTERDKAWFAEEIEKIK